MASDTKSPLHVALGPPMMMRPVSERTLRNMDAHPVAHL